MANLGVILKSFVDTSKLPSNKDEWPEYYKKRLAICDPCGYNTKNIKMSDLPFRLKPGKLMGKHQCSICSCFLKQKCFVKSEICAIYEVGEEPKWKEEGIYKTEETMSVGYNMVKASDVFVENKSMDAADMYMHPSGSHIVFDLGEITNDRVDDIYKLGVRPANGDVLKALFIAGCGCTNIKPVSKERGEYDLSFGLDFSGILNGKEIIKNVLIRYSEDESADVSNLGKEVVIKIKFDLNIEK